MSPVAKKTVFTVNSKVPDAGKCDFLRFSAYRIVELAIGVPPEPISDSGKKSCRFLKVSAFRYLGME
jgi:hypothetical protein